ncbi:MAG: polysaccharide biosynthesis C-terminal domain-containing protein [Planctomycetota bacterium]
MSFSLKKIISASVIYSLGDFLSVGVSGLLLIPLYLHYMEPAEYGVYGVVSTLLLLLSVVMQFGLLSAIARYFFIYRKTGEHYDFLGSIWLLQTVIGLVLAVLSAVFMPYFWPVLAPNVSFSPYFWLLLASALLSFSAGLYPIWLRNENKAVPFVALQVATLGLTLLTAVVFLAVFHLGAMGAVGAMALTAVAQTAISILCLARVTRWRFRWQLVRAPLVFGFWMASGTLCYVLLSRTQILALQQYSDLATVGIFNLALQFSGMLMLFGNSFGKAWQPVIYGAADSAEASVIIERTARWWVAGMLFIAMGLSFFSGDILRLLARREYLTADAVIRLTVIASFIYGLTQLPAAALLYQNRAGLSQVIAVIAAGLNIFFLVIFVPRWQAAGAAWAMICAFTVYTVLSYLVAQRILPVRYDWRALGKILLCGAIIFGLEALYVYGSSGMSAVAVRALLWVSFPLALLGLGVLKRPFFLKSTI